MPEGTNSVVVTTVGVPTTFPISQHIEDDFRAIHSTAQSELTDAKFVVWCTLQRFEVFRWVPPLIGDDLVEFARDAIPRVIVKVVEIPS
jgi:hypothetical protein